MKRNYYPLYVSKTTLGKDLDKEYLEDYCLKNNVKYPAKRRARKNAKRIMEFIRSNSLSQAEISVFNKILGDHQILSKLIFVYDGSYLRNRILYNDYNWSDTIIHDKNCFMINVALDDDATKDKYDYYEVAKDMTDKQLLNFAKNHYEYIFMQLPYPSLFDDFDFDDDDYFVPGDDDISTEEFETFLDTI